MGRRRPQGGRGKPRGGGSAQGRGDGGDRNVWQDFSTVARSNEAFEDYYKTQKIVPEDEWSSFMTSLRADLPTTFRVTESRSHAQVINDLIKERYLPEMHDVELDGKKFEPPFQLPWYPGSLAWQLDAPKRVVRKSEPYKRFQRFLVGETEVGNLSRQEAVSMIPPLLLGVKPHHMCLDMCAAPGSKTAQIIEALNPHHTDSSGLLIANDSDHKRTHMLVHQTGRMPSKGLMVTNLDASAIPNISLGEGQTLAFDRILADVPCSGDGTLRKNLEIWGKWNCHDGNSLHSLQLRILLRAMSMLKAGGRLVYSTCSFNPVEDEAVIATALNAEAGQGFSIADASSLLPGLKRRPGINHWKVGTQTQTEKSFVWHDTFEAYEEWAGKLPNWDKEKTRKWPKTLWPPENAADLGLEKCLRLLPQDQNTGGFFVCVIEKAATADVEAPKAVELPAVPPMDSVTTADEAGPSSLKRAASPSTVIEAQPEGKRARTEEDSSSTAKATQKKPKRDITFREEPFSFVDSNNDEVKSIVRYFDLKETFPRGNLLVRNEYGDPVRNVYITNDIVKRIIENNDYTRMRLISAGVRGFVRQDSAQRTEDYCKWRIPSESILETLPYLGDAKVVETTLSVLRIFLEDQYPVITKFPAEVQEWMNKLPLGNTIVRFAPGEEAGGHLPIAICMPVWKATTSLSLLIDKKEKTMLSLRTFGEDICVFGQPLKDKAATGENGPAKSGSKVEGGAGEASKVATDDDDEADALEAQINGGNVKA